MVHKAERVHPRVEMVVAVMRPDGSYPVEGRSKDVSLGGVFVEGWSDPVGTETMILLGDGHVSVGTRARVAHVGRTGVGLQFLDPPEAFVSALNRLITVCRAQRERL
jgi:hypothetical protein